MQAFIFYNIIISLHIIRGKIYIINIDNSASAAYYIDIRYIDIRYIGQRYKSRGVCMKKTAEDFLPLTETTYLILASLWQPLHGYGIMQNVEKITKSRIILAPGTLYGALSKLTKDKLIEIADEDSLFNKKKTYILTPMGRDVVKSEYKRLETLVNESKILLEGVNFDQNQKGI